MGLLERFEQRLDRLVNGAFARAFKAEVQPVEIAAALTREIDDRAAVVSRGRTVVPNVFTVELAPHDHERLSVYAEPLRGELAQMVRDHVAEQQYSLLGPVDVVLDVDPDLDTGIFRVRSEARAGVTAAAGPASPVTGGTPRVEIAGVPYPLVKPVTLLGRGPDTDIRIDDPGVSRHHAHLVLERADAAAEVRDLGSTNGTLVDGRPITGPVRLQDGMVVTLGTTELLYRSG